MVKLVVLYRPNSEHARAVDDFLHDFKQRYSDIRQEVLNIDTREGSAIASIYDITSYPALLALENDGSVSMSWQGEQLPLIDEVAGYTLAR